MFPSQLFLQSLWLDDDLGESEVGRTTTERRLDQQAILIDDFDGGIFLARELEDAFAVPSVVLPLARVGHPVGVRKLALAVALHNNRRKRLSVLERIEENLTTTIPDRYHIVGPVPVVDSRGVGEDALALPSIVDPIAYVLSALIRRREHALAMSPPALPVSRELGTVRVGHHTRTFLASLHPLPIVTGAVAVNPRTLTEWLLASP